MTLLVPNNGEGDILKAAVNHTAATDPILCLYSSNTTPAETDTTATYTECTGSGYSSATLTGASWTITEGAPSNASYAQQTFTFSGALGNVYGYFIKRTTSGRIAWAERFSDAPNVISQSGDQIKVTPILTLD